MNFFNDCTLSDSFSGSIYCLGMKDFYMENVCDLDVFLSFFYSLLITGWMVFYGRAIILISEMMKSISFDILL